VERKKDYQKEPKKQGEKEIKATGGRKKKEEIQLQNEKS
jgi:hypothetical protein